MGQSTMGPKWENDGREGGGDIAQAMYIRGKKGKSKESKFHGKVSVRASNGECSRGGGGGELGSWGRRETTFGGGKKKKNKGKTRCKGMAATPGKDPFERSEKKYSDKEGGRCNVRV